MLRMRACYLADQFFLVMALESSFLLLAWVNQEKTLALIKIHYNKYIDRVQSQEMYLCCSPRLKH